MDELQLGSMQRVARLQCGGGYTVGPIAQYRMPDVSTVDANLVRAAGVQRQVQCGDVAGQGTVCCGCVVRVATGDGKRCAGCLSVWPDAPQRRCFGYAFNAGIDFACIRFHVTGNKRSIATDESVVKDVLGEPVMGVGVFCK